MIDKLIDFSLQNRLLMVLFSIMVVIAGYRAYTQLPIDAFPDVSPNLVQVFTETEGLAPEEIEMYVTYPVEGRQTRTTGRQSKTKSQAQRSLLGSFSNR